MNATLDPQADRPETEGSTTVSVEFGRIDTEGNVWVKDGDSERIIGGYPEDVPEDPFSLYVRRFLDLEAKVNLFEARMGTLNSRDIDATLKSLNEQLAEPAVIGDLPKLRARLAKLSEAAEARKEEIQVERAAAKSEALTARTEIVEQAEAIAAQDIDSTQWKQSGQQLRELLDVWKESQRRGPRLDKSVEDQLWKRFSSARTTFDRNRRQYFTTLDANQKAAKETKLQLIAEAEALQNSEDWGATSGEYRRLMDQWRRAGRASRKDDDALWATFRAAQQVFFDRRRAKDRENEEQYSVAREQKEQLLAEAEALLPISDLGDAKEKLRDIQNRWEETGRVANRDVARLEGRLRDVEHAIRREEEREWERSNPETQARAAGMIAQLEISIADLQQQLEAAAGDEKKTKSIQAALDTKQAWLKQVQESVN